MKAVTDAMVIERRGSIASVVLARPKALNSLNLPMVRTLWDAFTQSAADAQVSAIVVTGAGGKAFCAGGDVRLVMEAAQRRGETLAAGEEELSDAFFRE
eukprot:1297899-Prymnesium_polylepis.1